MRTSCCRKKLWLGALTTIFVFGLFFWPKTSFAETGQPATVFITLAQPPEAGMPLTLVIQVGLHVAIDSVELTLTTPRVGAMGEGNTTLWSGSFDSNFPNSFNYTTPVLYPGKYVYCATLQAKSLEGNIVEARGNLFADVRPNTILTSPVSFERIRKLELIKEIKEKELSIKPEYKLIIMPIEELEKIINGGNRNK